MDQAKQNQVMDGTVLGQKYGNVLYALSHHIAWLPSVAQPGKSLFPRSLRWSAACIVFAVLSSTLLEGGLFRPGPSLVLLQV